MALPCAWLLDVTTHAIVTFGCMHNLDYQLLRRQADDNPALSTSVNVYAFCAAPQHELGP